MACSPFAPAAAVKSGLLSPAAEGKGSDAGRVAVGIPWLLSHPCPYAQEGIGVGAGRGPALSSLCHPHLVTQAEEKFLEKYNFVS